MNRHDYRAYAAWAESIKAERVPVPRHPARRNNAKLAKRPRGWRWLLALI